MNAFSRQRENSRESTNMKPDTTIIGIDPGNTHSAAVVLHHGQISPSHVYLPNEEFLVWLDVAASPSDTIVCEMIASYGMPVGREVFETCVFIGKLIERYPRILRVTRTQVKSTICHSAKAKDSNIRQALLDTYGPPGTKNSRGQTYGLSGDKWAALAVATAYRAGCTLYDPQPGGLSL